MTSGQDAAGPEKRDSICVAIFISQWLIPSFQKNSDFEFIVTPAGSMQILSQGKRHNGITVLSLQSWPGGLRERMQEFPNFELKSDGMLTLHF